MPKELKYKSPLGINGLINLSLVLLGTYDFKCHIARIETSCIKYEKAFILWLLRYENRKLCNVQKFAKTKAMF